MEDYDAPPELQEAPSPDEEWSLGSETPITTDLNRPSWLNTPPPKKRPFNWPSGGKSPSWFKKIAVCPLQHAFRYRHKKKDPTGLLGAVGNVVHGALEDAANIRAMPGRRGTIPPHAGPRELLYLLELQSDCVRQDLNVIDGEQASAIVTTEVLARAREIVSAIQPVNLGNIWVEPRTGKVGAEFIWNFRVTPSLLAAGIADLIQFVPDTRDPTGPPAQIVISDWKTGAGQLPTREELELDAQAGLQLCWARRAFPQTPRILFKLVNLFLREEVCIEWTPGIDQLMLSFARSCAHLWTTKNEAAVTGSHCSYCPFRTECAPHDKYLRDQAFRPTPGLAGMEMPQLVAEWKRAKVLSDIAERRRIDAGKIILEQMGNQSVYRTGNLVARKKTRRMPQYKDESGLMIALAERTGTSLEAVINSACRINKAGLEGWIKTLPVEKQRLAREMIEHHQSLNQTPPWLEVSEKEPVF